MKWTQEDKNHETGDTAMELPTKRLCSNCAYHLGGQCEVRELEDQTNGCGDWKYTNG